MADDERPAHEQISQRAYQIYLERGESSDAAENWHLAEEELQKRALNSQSPTSVLKSRSGNNRSRRQAPKKEPSRKRSLKSRILLADDSPAVRRVLKVVLSEQASVWEIFESGTGSETLEKVVGLQPQVVVLDLNFPDMPGHEVAQRIRQLCPTTKIIICSLSDSVHLAAITKLAGADGYFIKDSDSADLQKTITSVLSRDFVANSKKGS